MNGRRQEYLPNRQARLVRTEPGFSAQTLAGRGTCVVHAAMLARLCKRALRQWPDTSPRPVTSLALVAGDRSLVWGLKQHLPSQDSQEDVASTPTHLQSRRAGTGALAALLGDAEEGRSPRPAPRPRPQRRVTQQPPGSRPPAAPPLTALTGLTEWPADLDAPGTLPGCAHRPGGTPNSAPCSSRHRCADGQSTDLCSQ